MEVDLTEEHKWRFKSILHLFLTTRVDQSSFLQKFILYSLVSLKWLLLYWFDWTIPSVLDRIVVLWCSDMLHCAHLQNLPKNRGKGSKLEGVPLRFRVHCDLLLHKNTDNFWHSTTKCSSTDSIITHLLMQGDGCIYAQALECPQQWWLIRL